MVEALDGQDAAPSIQRLRGWSQAAASLLPGMTVLHVGSGTGTVLQHLPDPQTAVTEIARVLKSGGRAMLIDSDHETRVDSDIEPGVARAIRDAFVAQIANPRAARHIRRQAIAAGLDVNPDFGSAALVFPLDVLAESRLLRVSADQAVADGTITREQADEAIRAHVAAARNGWALSAITVFSFNTSKP